MVMGFKRESSTGALHQQTQEQLQLDLLINTGNPFLCCPNNNMNHHDLYHPGSISHDYYCHQHYLDLEGGYQLPPTAAVGKEKKVKASAQSVAARERRRKITDKTQQLGRLVPGGTKMNTAEMLHAAFKYVKFLQAQVALLASLSHSPHDDHYDSEVQQSMHLLLTSAPLQEKLSVEAKCLVPTRFLANFALLPHPLSRDLNRLLASQAER